MKVMTMERSRKRRQQKTSLLMTRKNNKNSIQQHKMKTATTVKKHEANKIPMIAGFAESNFNDNEQFTVSTRGNEALFAVKKNFRHKQADEPYQLHKIKLISRESTKIYGGTHCCTCLACKRKSMIISQQKRKKQEQIRTVNNDWIFRQQQMINYQLQGKSTRKNVPVSQNKLNNYYKLIHANKRAYLSTATQNIQLPIPPTTVKQSASFNNNFSQQNFEYKPHLIAAQKVGNCSFEKNIDFHNHYFPSYHQHNHLTALNYFSAFQGSNGSLTSSVESVDGDTNNMMTSPQQFGNTLVTSQNHQMMKNSDFYSFFHY